MAVVRPDARATGAAASDAELVKRVLARDGQAFRTIMTRHNQRLYRLARGIVGRAWEAEDVVQESYMRAFRSLETFHADSALSTWLSRIVINEALGRLRKAKREGRVVDLQPSQAEVIQFPGSAGDDPERTMAQRQILHLVEEATDKLPHAFRAVFVARIIEGLSVEETAELLGIRPETVKTRLHRARQMVRRGLDAQIGPVLMDAFPFAGRRCERLTETVMRRLGLED
jgi:RNA polymerase sigma-70 factor (ECF subfamily)